MSDVEDVLDEVGDLLEAVNRSDASQEQLLTAVRAALTLISADEEEEEGEDEDDDEDENEDDFEFEEEEA